MADQGTSRVKVCPGHQRAVAHISYSSMVEDGGFWLVSSSHDAHPMLREGRTGDWVGHKGAVFCSCFDGAAERIATASGDYTARLWCALSGQELAVLQHPHCVRWVDWFPASPRVVTAGMDRRIRVYEAGGSDSPVQAQARCVVRIEHATQVFVGHESSARGVAFGKGPDEAFSVGADNTLKRWDLRAQECVERISVPDLLALEFCRPQNLLVVTSRHAVTIISPNDGLAKPVETHAFADDVEFAAVSPVDGEHIALGSGLRVKEVARRTGAEVESHKGHHGPVFSVRYAPDSRTYASGSEDGFVRIWPSHPFLRGAVSSEP